MKLILTKLAENENPVHPNNIPVGEVIEIQYPRVVYPQLGHRFPQQWWYSTSIVTEVLEDNKFRTLNSLYQFKFEDDDANPLSKLSESRSGGL